MAHDRHSVLVSTVLVSTVLTSTVLTSTVLAPTDERPARTRAHNRPSASTGDDKVR
ncbi:hypothetical protein AB0C08_19710 [Microbispora bryophytorum]|uniref:hypothetical protein n=1 Tax=Microbispora bryophytorum TaxID=1460882 RepID=UPI003408D622